MDEDLVSAATEAIQAQERLQIELRAKRNDSALNQKAFQSSCTMLYCLRNMKSELEHTAMTSEPVSVKEEVLADIRNLVLIHVPGTMSSETKQRLQSLIKQAFDGSCRDLVFAGLVTCPWYRATQQERGLQAKYNTVFVVYAAKDEQFFSPVNSHDKEKDTGVIDKGWFYAAEVNHFANSLLKGKARFVESLSLPDTAIIFSNNYWDRLKTELSTDCLGLRGFLEQCRGQAVGSVGKKCKNTGKMRLRDGASLREFCESFRLLHHAAVAMNDGMLLLDVLDTETLPAGVASTALQALTESYQVLVF